ncbi:MAG TPA: aldehyde dehydrogenase family protein [Bacillales bacterium]|nr:aldehyde dehydrogenase family protein [Bacillales bacterium]
MVKVTTTGQKMLIGGRWEDREETIEVRDPEDNSIIDAVPAASAEDMRLAIREAKKGVEQAARMPVYERAAILKKAADIVAERKELFATIIARESSKTIREARSEVSRCVQTLQLSGEEASRINGETVAYDQVPGSENRLGYYYHFPKGLIGAITPFNDPLNLVAHKVGPAIAGGNAIIVKPATVTPLSALYLAEAFLDAGLPAHVLSVITGRGAEVCDPLVTNPDVNMISFTGGYETGEAITRKAGVKAIGMELGSNSPVIVLKDADLRLAVEATVSGAFSAAGQNCIGVQRVYVEETVYAAFAEAFVAETKRLRTGRKLSETTDIGPLIDEREARRTEAWVREAVEKGASVLHGGTRSGAFYEPTVLAGVSPEAKVYWKEAFGPVVSLFPARDLDAAITAANDVDYGLQAGVFTQDLNKAFYALQRLKVGGVMINDSSDYRVDAMPFGGVKGSGVGREGVKFAIREMTEKKVVCFKLIQ